MHERSLYAARPINTYGTSLEEAYLEFLRRNLLGSAAVDIIDTNGPSIRSYVEKLRALHSRDPLTGAYSEKLYNTVASAEIMKFYAKLVKTCDGGAGLLLPVETDARVLLLPTETDATVALALSAGVAKELRAIFEECHPVFLVSCERDGFTLTFTFHLVERVTLNAMRTDLASAGLEDGKREELYDFITSEGKVFPQLSIQETRERIYYWPDRKRMQPYFLGDVADAAVPNGSG